MTTEEFQKTCSGLVQEMRNWFFGLDASQDRVYTPEEAFTHQLQEQAKTLEQQLAFAKRAIQDGRQAKEFLQQDFGKAVMTSIRRKHESLPLKTLKTAKTMEDVAYAKGFLEGCDVWTATLEEVVRIGKAAEATLVALTKRQGGA